MSFFGAIFKVADMILAGAQVVDRGIDVGKSIARKLGLAKKPDPVQAKTGRDVIHIHNQSKAGAENHRLTDTQRLPVMRPPPRKPRL